MKNIAKILLFIFFITTNYFESVLKLIFAEQL